MTAPAQGCPRGSRPGPGDVAPGGAVVGVRTVLLVRADQAPCSRAPDHWTAVLTRAGAAATTWARPQPLVGMREQTAVLGDRFEAGPLPAGGFRVCASLPYGPGADA